MFEFIGGIIVGFITAYLTSTERYRVAIYEKKYEAYRLIHDTAGQVFFYGLLCMEKEDVYEKAFNTCQYNLMIDLFQNELIISEKVITNAGVLTSYDIPGIRKDKDGFVSTMGNLVNSIRRELKVKEIHRITSVLLLLPTLGLDGLLNEITARMQNQKREKTKG